MRETKILSAIAVLFLISLPMNDLRADDPTTISPTSKRRVAAEVHATLGFTECVAKLLSNGLGAQEARQLCIDTVAN